MLGSKLVNIAKVYRVDKIEYKHVTCTICQILSCSLDNILNQNYDQMRALRHREGVSHEQNQEQKGQEGGINLCEFLEVVDQH